VERQNPPQPDQESLVAIFYPRPDNLGRFTPVSADQTPSPYRELLSHDHHMTVTVEAYHDSPVDVNVLTATNERGKYCRRIVLHRQSDSAVVLFGIVRLNIELLDQPVRDQILGRRTPLGRVLIQHGVMRDIEMHQLYKVQCGTDLAKLFAVPEGTTTFGRTALIYCNREPAVELLEIVAPSTSIRKSGK
jgi:chorismate-pyruvate lyase